MDSNNNAAQCVWSVAVERLKQTNDFVYRQWFRLLVPVALDGRCLTLGVSDIFFAQIISDQYDDLIVAALRDLNGGDYSYQLKADASYLPAASDAPEPPSPVSAPVRTVRDPEASYNEEQNFENFVVGTENRFGYAAARAVADAPGKIYNPLFIYGVSGIGKTHLLNAVSCAIQNKFPQKIVRATTCGDLLNEYYSTLLAKRSFDNFRAALCKVDVLLVDDVQMLSGKTQLQNEFFNIFELLQRKRKQIVLASDRPPYEIAELDRRLVSRFEQDMSVEITPPEYDARLAILRMLRDNASAVPGVIPDEVLEFIAENIRSNVRMLRSSFVRISAYSSFSGNPVSVEIAEDLLQNQIAQEISSQVLTIDYIQRTVASHFGITVADLLGDSRHRSFAEPRMVAMYLCRELTGNSSNQIGSAFARNHATVLHAEKKVVELCGMNKSLKTSVSRLKRQLQRKRH